MSNQYFVHFIANHSETVVEAYGGTASCRHQDPRSDKKILVQKAKGIRYADSILPPETTTARAKATADSNYFDGSKHVKCLVSESSAPALVPDDALTATANE